MMGLGASFCSLCHRCLLSFLLESSPLFLFGFYHDHSLSLCTCLLQSFLSKNSLTFWRCPEWWCRPRWVALLWHPSPPIIRAGFVFGSSMPKQLACSLQYWTLNGPNALLLMLLKHNYFEFPIISLRFSPIQLFLCSKSAITAHSALVMCFLKRRCVVCIQILINKCMLVSEFFVHAL